MKNNKGSYNDSDYYSEKVIENNIEVHMIFMLKFVHYWLNNYSEKNKSFTDKSKSNTKNIQIDFQIAST